MARYLASTETIRLIKRGERRKGGMEVCVCGGGGMGGGEEII